MPFGCFEVVIYSPSLLYVDKLVSQELLIVYQKMKYFPRVAIRTIRELFVHNL